VAALCSPAPVNAQASAPEAEAPAASADVEEIRVTISKRDEALSEIPASVSAFSGELLEQADFESISDLATLVPGFITKGEGRTGAITIRGISEGFTGQASVARHINGVFQRDGGLSYTGMYYDLKTIEVTRGPAGTVYGRNATAGAVNVIWNEPHAEWEVNGDATLGNYGRKQLRGVVNVPFFGAGDERLMGRFSVQRELRDGYLDDDFQNEHDDVQNSDEWYLRGALRSRIGEDASLELRGYYTHSDANTNMFRPLVDTYSVGVLELQGTVYPFDWAGGLQQFKAGLLAAPTIWRLVSRQEFLAGLFPSQNAALEDILLVGRDINGNGVISVADGDLPPIVRSPEFFSPALPIHANPLRTRSRLIQNAGRRPELTIYAGDGQLDWHLGDFAGIGSLDFRVLGGYQFLEIHQLSDADGTELGAIDSIQHHTRNSYTLDAQLITDGEDVPLDLILGFFYFHSSDDRPDQHALTPLGDFPSDEYRVTEGLAPYLSGSLRPLELFSDDPALDLEIFAGVRWNRDSEHLEQTNGATVLRPFASLAGDVTFREWTWEAGARWFLDENHLLYAKYATNYKPGFQQLDLTNLASAPVAPEHIQAWEFGWKAGWWDRRLNSALTVFRYSYTDLQVPQLINNQVFTVNAAEAENWGVELELSASPTDAWLVQANAGLLKARFKEFCADDPAQNDSVDDPGCTRSSSSPLNIFNGQLNLEGNDLEDAPEWKLSLFTSYEIDLGAHGTLTPVLKITWTDSYFLRPFNLPMDRVAAYSRSDVRLRWDSPEQRYSVEGYVENLEDEVVFARTTVGPDFTGGFPASVGVLPPRMYGVRAGFHWGGD
jgi:iron complex outermembrane receptor protein